MSKTDRLKIINYCDGLTKHGEKLAVTWSGGNDSGWFQLELDGEPIHETSKLDDSITDLVENELGYGSFAGDFSTDGELIYNRDTKSFEGTDTYSETSSEKNDCAIEIYIPKNIWFDQLEVQIEASYETIEEASVRFIITNGPRIPAHSELENQLKQKILKKFLQEIRKIDECTSVWENFILKFDEFISKGKERVFTIKQFEYNFCDSRDNHINIYLTDKINDDVTV